MITHTRLKINLLVSLLVVYAHHYWIDGLIHCTQKLMQTRFIIAFFHTCIIPVKARGLELSREKTRITHIEEGFDFLGQNIRKYKGKLLIKPSKKNVKTFLGKVRETVKGNKQAKAGNR